MMAMASTETCDYTASRYGQIRPSLLDFGCSESVHCFLGEVRPCADPLCFIRLDQSSTFRLGRTLEVF